MARKTGKQSPCTAAEAATRLAHAQKFLEVAELVATEEEISASLNCSAALAVLAGIAASDAACCAALGVRSRAQDHRDGSQLLEQIEPGGREAGAALSKLIDIKDTAHYGLTNLSKANLTRALRSARQLLEFAAGVARR